MLPLRITGPGSDGNKGVFCIPQICSITGASPSDVLVLYLDIRWGSRSILGHHPTGQEEKWSKTFVELIFKASESLRYFVDTIIEKKIWPCWVNVRICVDLLMFLFIFLIKLFLSYNRPVYYYTRIYLISPPHSGDDDKTPVSQFGECGKHINNHYSQVHSNMEWLYFLSSYQWIK